MEAVQCEILASGDEGGAVETGRYPWGRAMEYAMRIDTVASVKKLTKWLAVF